jgi:hypothetical protein
MTCFRTVSFALTFVCLPLFATVAAKVTTLQNVLFNGPVTDESVSGTGSLDGEKLSSVSNISTYEW